MSHINRMIENKADQMLSPQMRMTSVKKASFSTSKVGSIKKGSENKSKAGKVKAIYGAVKNGLPKIYDNTCEAVDQATTKALLKIEEKVCGDPTIKNTPDDKDRSAYLPTRIRADGVPYQSPDIQIGQLSHRLATVTGTANEAKEVSKEAKEVSMESKPIQKDISKAVPVDAKEVSKAVTVEDLTPYKPDSQFLSAVDTPGRIDASVHVAGSPVPAQFLPAIDQDQDQGMGEKKDENQDMVEEKGDSAEVKSGFEDVVPEVKSADEVSDAVETEAAPGMDVAPKMEPAGEVNAEVVVNAAPEMGPMRIEDAMNAAAALQVEPVGTEIINFPTAPIAHFILKGLIKD